MADRDLLVLLHAEAEQILARVRTLVDQLEAALVATHQPPREPIRLVPRDHRQTQSYASVSAVPCQRDGCQRPSGETAYCEVHEEMVRG